MSTDGHVSRLPLLRSLINAGSQVTHVASQHSGSGENNANGCYIGWMINEIADGARPDLQTLPNVVLLHADTYNMNKDSAPGSYDTASDRLVKLMDKVLRASRNVTLIAPQIIQSGNPGTEERTPMHNAATPDVVDASAAQGSKVLRVDMSSIGVGGSDLLDGLHLDDKRYELMTGFWFDTLKQASERQCVTAGRASATGL